MLPPGEDGMTPTQDRTPTPVVGTPELSVTRIHVPLVVTAGLIGAIVAGLVGLMTVWVRTVDHQTNQQLHLDPKTTTEGGGPAFKLDVEHARQDCDREIQAEHARMRRLLRAMTFHCENTTKRGGAMNCRVELPESAE